jgi:hypothetical protein
MVGGPGACDGHEDPNFAGPSPESTGGYSSVTPGRSAGAGDSGGGDRAEQQKHVDKAKARVVTAAKAILKIVMDIVGVTSALDCFTTGDLGSCIETGLNVLMSFVGGLGAKIVAKYAWRFKAAYRLGKQLKNLVTELVDGVREWRGASKALAETKEFEAAKGVGESCELANSFAPGTAVLLADGSSKPIEKMKLGDLVVAADPETGKTAAKAVTRLIAGAGDKNLVQVTVDTDGPGGKQTGTMVATDHHPFWVPQLHRWVDATDLQAGQWLQTSSGTWVQITAVTRWTEHARVHNLTIDDLHTYYVLAGKTPVLVHNCNGATLDLKYKDSWTAEQRAAADAKVAAVNSADRLVVTEVRRSGSAADVWRANGRETVPGTDIDHKVDLQLGGADHIDNMWPLDSSVNRSLGAQISAQLRAQGLKAGDTVCSVTISARC